MSEVVTLDKTLVFHASLVCAVSSSRVVPLGICESTLAQACSVEIKDTPTLEVTLVAPSKV